MKNIGLILIVAGLVVGLSACETLPTREEIRAEAIEAIEKIKKRLDDLAERVIEADQ